MSIADMKAEIRQDDIAYDPWGTVMSWRFDLCDWITFEACFDVPSDWEFRPGAGQCEPEADCPNYPYEDELQADVLAFGELLKRYTDKLRQAGKDY